MARKKGGLGRGLDALFADAAPLYDDDLDELQISPAVSLGTVEEGNELAEATEESSIKRKNKAADKSKESKNRKSADQNSIYENSRKIKESESSESKSDSDDEDRVIYIDINDIKPNKDQPRKTFNEDRLKDLANSIKENGVIQPLIVRKSGFGYELVAGERRWRAARIAELKKVPCIIRNFDEKQNMIVAIIENMQRENLDAIEEALGLSEMIKRFGFTQEQVSNALGKSRAYIANSLRLLKLPYKVQDLIVEGKISAAHGRTIITIPDEKKQIDVCDKIVRNGLSVRATERLAEKIKDDSRPARKKRKSNIDPEIATVEDELRRLFGTKVNINGKEKIGKIEIEYYSLEELNRLIDMLRRAN